MKLNEFIKNFNLKNQNLYVASLFGNTLNCLNLDDIHTFELNYEVLNDYQDSFSKYDYIVEISNKDYQDILKKLNEKGGK